MLQLVRPFFAVKLSIVEIVIFRGNGEPVNHPRLKAEAFDERRKPPVYQTEV
jgi:hypothetical protein